MLSENNSLSYTENYTKDQLNLTWESKIIIAHSGGIGGIVVPEIYINKLHKEEYYEITFLLNNQDSFSKLLKLSKIKNKYVFYLPKEFEYLISKNVTVHLIYNNFIPIKLCANDQITLPISLINKFQLQDHDIYEIEIIVNTHVFNKIVLINRKDRSKEREKRQISKEKFNDSYYILFPYDDVQRGIEGKLKLIRKLEPPIYSDANEEKVLYVPNVYYNNDNKFFIGKINENQIIVLAERFLSVQLPLYIHINNSMIYYFGNYLADGSTHGDSSAINASNHIQADYLIKVYSSFIYDSNLNFYLAFTKLATDLRTDQEIIIELKKYWQSIHNIIIDDKRIRIWTSKYESRIGTKITDYGSLEISDARSIVKILYNKLMEKITFLLLRSKSPSLIWKFLLGYLEGDGSIHTSRVGRFYIKFAANKDNVGLLTKLLDIVDVGYHISNAGNGRNIYIEIEEALKHFNYYASEIFKYYPKRRKIFVIRFFKNPSVHYLTGYRNSINQPSVEKFLNENIKNNNTIMNEIKILEQELHGYGLKILDFVNELNEYGKYLPVRTK